MCSLFCLFYNFLKVPNVYDTQARRWIQVESTSGDKVGGGGGFPHHLTRTQWRRHAVLSFIFIKPVAVEHTAYDP